MNGVATFFLRQLPTPGQLNELHFSEELHGGNTWLVLPGDDGVFDGQREVDGVPCVHPVQAYIDLKDQPERATEAAEHLLETRMPFGGRRRT
jgi:hypothetical protein